MFFKKKPQLDSYLQELAKQQVFVISLNKNSGFELKGASDEALIDHLDRNAHETSDNGTFALFFLEQENRRVYPVFTDDKRSGIWVQKKSFSWSSTVTFTQIGMNATTLFRKFKGAPATVVFVINPLSDDERVLTHKELQALAQL